MHLYPGLKEVSFILTFFLFIVVPTDVPLK